MEARVAFIGMCSGKTSILNRKIQGEFDNNTAPTSEENYEVLVNLDGKTTQLDVCDTSEFHEYAPLIDKAIKWSTVLVFTFSISYRLTFEDLDFYTHREGVDSDDKIRILVGNMADEEDKREVAHDEAEDYARAHGMRYIETSAKTNQDVDALFELIVREYRRLPPPAEKHSNSGEGLCTVF